MFRMIGLVSGNLYVYEKGGQSSFSKAANTESRDVGMIFNPLELTELFADPKNPHTVSMKWYVYAARLISDVLD